MKPFAEDIMRYRERFGYCYIAEPGNDFVVEHEGLSYRAPEGETPEGFKKRLDKSISADKNLFPEEYEEFDPYPDKDAIY